MLCAMKRQKLVRLVARNLSTRQMADALGCSKTNVRYWLKKYGLRTKPSRTARPHRPMRRKEVRAAVKRNTTASGTLRDLGFNVNGGTHGRLLRKIREWNISTSHWLGYGHAKGRQAYNKGRGKPLSEVMVGNSTYPRCHLKRRLLEEGVLANRCAWCGLGPEWNGRPLVLVLDHINGVKNDHRPKNLRLLCPNCNSQTPTFCGKNIGRVPVG